MSVLWFSHPDCLHHLNPPGHPEQVARLRAVEAALQPLGLIRREAPLAAEADVLRCHSARYLTRLQSTLPEHGLAPLDPDTWLSPGSLTAALRAAGGAVAAVDAVLANVAKAAFVGARPPGHHAERDRAMGFCLLDSIAIAARHALDHHGLSRVAIVDFDVHHGNGTQSLLWDEPRVLYVSSHQMPLYPGSGARSEIGANGNILNLPLPPGSDGAAMQACYLREALPRLAAFRPELLLISAGFDAHVADPLAQLEWETGDFAWLTDRLCELAATHCGGRVVSTLEGGYDLSALAASVAAHVDRLLVHASKE